MSGNTQTTAPGLLDVDQLAAFLNIGRTSVYRWDSLGLIGPKSMKLGDRKLWDAEEVQRWIRAKCPNRQRWLDMEKRGR